MDCARAVSLKVSTSQQTPYTVQNLSKLIDFVIRIELTRAILKLSEKFDHPFSHVFIFGNMFPESHGFVAVPVTRPNNFVSLTKLDRDKLEHVSLIQLVTNRHSNETVTLWKHVIICKTCKNWWPNFSGNLRTVHGIKIARDNSILITKSINVL